MYLCDWGIVKREGGTMSLVCRAGENTRLYDCRGLGTKLATESKILLRPNQRNCCNT